MAYLRSYVLIIHYILISGIVFGQSPHSLNLDFEELDDNAFPYGWTHRSLEQSHIICADSTTVYHGKYAMLIDGPYSVKRTLSAPSSGNKVSLRGHMKTENVRGFAGLWLRIDGMEGPLAINNMLQERVDGTRDWKEYTVDLNYDLSKAVHIALGGIVAGEGKAWIDDLHLYIDGVEVQDTFQRNMLLKVEPIVPLTHTQIKDFTRLAALWGFLKYHHPYYTGGHNNADNELLTLMDKIYYSSGKKETDKILNAWLDEIGMPKDYTNKTAYNPGSTTVKGKPRYNILFSKRYFSRSISAQTKLILQNMGCSVGQYYVSRKSMVTTFDNENPYSNIIIPDWRLRLLALFRYWNVIEYFYPYRYLINNWEEVLEKHIEVFYNARTEADYLLACQALICCIKDAHAINNKDYVMLQQATNIAPLRIDFVQNTPVITHLYPRGATDTLIQLLAPGSIVTKINNLPVADLIRNFLPLTSGSNPETKMRDIWEAYLLRTNQSILRLSILDGTSEKDLAIPTIPLNIYYDRKFAKAERETISVIHDSICYIPLAAFQLPIVRKALSSNPIRRIIIDVRQPPLTQAQLDSVHAFIGMYVSVPQPYVSFSTANFCHPGYFQVLKTQFTPLKPSNIQQHPPKVFLLVDEYTQSHSECITMALQHIPGALTLGSRTAGADGDITSLSLPGGLITTFTGLGTYYPDGTETQQVGIKIDRTVYRSVKGIREGIDELIEVAKRM